jgi:hypothetical protein
MGYLAPAPPAHGDVAQLEEHLLCKQGVVGSSPIVSTRKAPMRDIRQRRLSSALAKWLEEILVDDRDIFDAEATLDQ